MRGHQHDPEPVCVGAVPARQPEPDPGVGRGRLRQHAYPAGAVDGAGRCQPRDSLSRRRVRSIHHCIEADHRRRLHREILTSRMSATDLRRIGSTDLIVTALGFGSAPLGNRFRELDEDHCRSLVDDAWERGTRLFDTAPMYGFGLAENRLGTALRNRPRAQYVLSTKVGRMLAPTSGDLPADPMWVNTPPMRIVYDYSYDGALRSIEDSLQRMLT